MHCNSARRGVDLSVGPLLPGNFHALPIRVPSNGPARIHLAAMTRVGGTPTSPAVVRSEGKGHPLSGTHAIMTGKARVEVASQ